MPPKDNDARLPTGRTVDAAAARFMGLINYQTEREREIDGWRERIDVQ